MGAGETFACPEQRVPTVMDYSNPDRPHDFADTVIAVFDEERAQSALDELNATQFDVEILQGTDGRSHLKEDAEGGFFAGLRKLARSLGDESRIIGALDAAMEQGKTVVSVAAPPDQAPEAARILEENGGAYIWRFGEWSFNQVGEISSDTEPEQEPGATRGTVDEKAVEEA